MPSAPLLALCAALLLGCSRSSEPAAPPPTIQATHMPPPVVPPAAPPDAGGGNADPFADLPGVEVQTPVGTIHIQGGAQSPVVSPKGDKVAFTRGDDLYVERVMSEQETLLVKGGRSNTPEANLTGLSSIAFSPDGGRIYFLAHAWGTTHALHAADSSVGSQSFLIDAVSFSVIPSGPHKGELIVNRLRSRLNDSGQEFVEPWLVTPEGSSRPLAGVDLDGGS